MTTQLTCRAEGFGSARFWSDLEKLASQSGHDGHPHHLAGETGHLNRYHLVCPRCSATIATVTVAHDAAKTHSFQG